MGNPWETEKDSYKWRGVGDGRPYRIKRIPRIL